MKKMLVFLFLLTIMLFSLTSCFERNILIQYENGSSEAVVVKDNETFSLSNYTVESKLFIGCYSSDSKDSKIYVDCDGNSLNWEENFPTKLVAKYVDLPLNITESRPTEFSIGYSGSKDISFEYPQAFTSYVKKNPNLKFDVNIKFKHYEKKTNILGVGASNWSECRIYVGSKNDVKSTDYLESNSGYKEFSKSFKLNASDFSTFMLGIDISRPIQNVSTQDSLYKDFSISIKEVIDSSTTIKKDYELIVQSDATLKPVIESSITRSVNITEDIINSAKSFDSKEVTIEVSCENYGAKDITGIFDNWGMLKVIFKSSNSTITQKEFVLQHNDDYRFDRFTIKMSKENFLKLAKIDLNFWYDNPSTFAGNHSGNWYYIRNISVNIML